MATNNAIDTDRPIQVSRGGTGQSTLTIHGLLLGNGTGAVVPLAATDTQLLTINAAGEPIFSNIILGNYTSYPEGPGFNWTIDCLNTDTTNTQSDARFYIETQSGSTGDPFIYFVHDGIQSYSLGIDNSDNDILRLTDDFSPSSGTTLEEWDTNGIHTVALQSSFLAVGTTDETDVTGDGTVYPLAGFGTEIFDRNFDFASNAFTAPITSRYYLCFGIELGDLTAGHTSGVIQIVTSNRTYDFHTYNFGVIKTSADTWAHYGSVVADMDALDTATLSLTISGGTKVVDIHYNGTSDPRTWFAGCLTW